MAAPKEIHIASLELSPKQWAERINQITDPIRENQTQQWNDKEFKRLQLSDGQGAIRRRRVLAQQTIDKYQGKIKEAILFTEKDWIYGQNDSMGVRLCNDCPIDFVHGKAIEGGKMQIARVFDPDDLKFSIAKDGALLLEIISQPKNKTALLTMQKAVSMQ